MRGLAISGGCFVLVTLVTAVAALAGDGGKEKHRFNKADQAAARAVLLRGADLIPSTRGWKGGPVKPDLSAGPRCANYHPKMSDLVLTGAAESDWTNSGIQPSVAA